MKGMAVMNGNITWVSCYWDCFIGHVGNIQTTSKSMLALEKDQLTRFSACFVKLDSYI